MNVINNYYVPEQNAPRYLALTEQPIGRQAESIDVDVLAFDSSTSMDWDGVDDDRPFLSPCIPEKYKLYLKTSNLSVNKEPKNKNENKCFYFNQFHSLLVFLSYNCIVMDHLKIKLQMFKLIITIIYY